MSLTMLQLRNSFWQMFCLMLAVMTLDHCPSQVYCSFAFVVDFEQVISFDYYSYFPHFYDHHYFFHFIFLLLLSLKIISISVVIFVIFFCLSLVYFVCFFCMLVDLFHDIDINTLMFVFLFLSVFSYLLWANILCIAASV